MASMRDIKRRKSSITSTSQITKAMKLVSTVKLQKARVAAENAKPYFENMYDVVVDMLSITDIFTSKYLNSPNSKDKKAIIVISSNRGLAGGYNNNIVKKVLESGEFTPDNTKIYGVGLKGAENLEKRGFQVDKEFLDVIENPLYSDAMKISEEVLSDFMDGEFGEIYIAYTEFKNTVSQETKLLKLLPVEREKIQNEDNKGKVLMNYEPNQHTSLDIIIPKYVTSIIYGALLEAMASENGARMTAMDSATDNAKELIEELSLEFNRARQSAITQELTEIIAGAESLG